MVLSQAKNAYRQTAMQVNYHPVELINMLYERVLVLLDAAVVAIEENRPVVRVENVNKAVAIVSELYVSVAQDDSESSRFLSGLYEAILAELPRASMNKDVEVLQRAHRYLSGLKKVWEDTAMRECGLVPGEKESSLQDTVESLEELSSVIVEKKTAYPSASPGGKSLGQVSFSV